MTFEDCSSCRLGIFCYDHITTDKQGGAVEKSTLKQEHEVARTPFRDSHNNSQSSIPDPPREEKSDNSAVQELSDGFNKLQSSIKVPQILLNGKEL
jgi:hypothetical protein